MIEQNNGSYEAWQKRKNTFTYKNDLVCSRARGDAK